MRGKAGSTPREFTAYVALPVDDKGQPIWPTGFIFLADSITAYRIKDAVIRKEGQRVFKLALAPKRKKK